MAVIQGIIDEAEQASTDGSSSSAGSTAAAAVSGGGTASAPLEEALADADVEFWVQVAQLIALLLILRELRRGS